MRFFVYQLLLALVVISVSSCATIINSRTQSVSVNSSPSKATVNINGVYKGLTPLVTELKRKKEHIVKINLQGYEPYELALNQTVSGWLAGNIVFGGIIGLVVDAMTGGMYKLEPNQITANLTKMVSTSQIVDGNIYISVVLEPKEDWVKIGQLTPISQ